MAHENNKIEMSDWAENKSGHEAVQSMMLSPKCRHGWNIRARTCNGGEEKSELPTQTF